MNREINFIFFYRFYTFQHNFNDKVYSFEMFNSSHKSDFNFNSKNYFHCSRRLLHSRQKIGLIKYENSRTPKRNESNTIIKRLSFRRKLHKNIQILKTMPLIEYFCTNDDDFYWKCYSCLLYWLLFTFPLMKIAKETVGYRAIYLISLVLSLSGFWIV